MKIKTKDLNLRHVRMSDAKGYLECYKDKDSQKGFMSAPRTLEEVKKNLRKKISQYRKKKPSSETFVVEVNGEFAGWVEINELNEKYFEHRGNIGYCIHPNFRRKGIATKAIKLLVSYALKKYKLKRIEGWCRTFNKGSAKSLKKAGFKLEGILRKDKCKNGKYLDDMVWAVVR